MAGRHLLSGCVLEKCIVRREVGEIPADLKALHPVLQRIFAARGCEGRSPLARKLADLHPPGPLKGIHAAVGILHRAMRDAKNIIIVGDFDADGATSTAVMVLALRAFGAENVDHFVPDRFQLGYGLTPQLVDAIASRKPDLIITVDNGITSVEGVHHANRLGMEVIITDHHLPGAQLPNAAAIVNPNQPGCDFPSKNLAGVGVAFYLMVHLRAYLQTQEWFSQLGLTPPNMAQFLDFVALGTVADVVSLDHNNRILVHQGLARIVGGQAHVGIQALIEVARLDPQKITTSDLGFYLAPRLNAAGRIENMALGIACLIAEDPTEAFAYARELETLNQERKKIESQMRITAEALMTPLNIGGDLGGICLFDPSWHQGVIGILAGRLKETYFRPVICFAKENDNFLKGSGRSIPGIHLRDLLVELHASDPALIGSFGGHAMAAGLKISIESLAKFQAAFEKKVSQKIKSLGTLKNEIQTDGELRLEDFTLDLACLLQAAGPWGQNFPEPCFDNVFLIENQRILKEKHIKWILKPLGYDFCVDAIAFNAINDGEIPEFNKMRAVFKLAVNCYQGQERLQLLVIYWEEDHE